MLAKAFGFEGDLGCDLMVSRMQEMEADHIRIIIMAETIFDPQGVVDLRIMELRKETELLDGDEPYPAF